MVHRSGYLLLLLLLLLILLLTHYKLMLQHLLSLLREVWWVILLLLAAAAIHDNVSTSEQLCNVLLCLLHRLSIGRSCVMVVMMVIHLLLL